MKRLFCILLTIGILYGLTACGSGTKDNATETEKDAAKVSETDLRELLSAETDLEIVRFHCYDYNADGALEAFAVAAQNATDQKASSFHCDLAEIWFVSAEGCKRLKEWDDVTGLDVPDAYELDKNTNCLGWAVAPTGGNHRWYYNYAVDKNGEPQQTAISVDALPETSWNYDGVKINLGGGITQPDLPHYFFFVEDNCRFVEYGGIEISETQFEKLKGSDGILEQIANEGGQIDNILYRSNDIININYTIDEDNPFDHHFVSLIIQDGSVTKEGEQGFSYGDDFTEKNIGIYYPSIVKTREENEDDFMYISKVTFPEAFPYSEEDESEPSEAVPVDGRTGWNFDSQTGTLSLFEQQFLDKTPFTGNRKNVKTVELAGSIQTVTPTKDQDGGLAIYPNLKKVVVDDGVQKIDSCAFEDCYNLEQIYIGSGVKEIAEDAFFGSGLDARVGNNSCVSLMKIEVSKDNRFFSAKDNVLYNKDFTELVMYPFSRQKTEYVIPDSVCEVRWFTFVENQTIQKLTVGKGIKSIEFGIIGCKALKELVLPDTLQSIGDSTIKRCGLQSAIIPDSVTSIGSEAFAGCDNLRKLYIGKNLVKSDYYLFCNSPVLDDVTIHKDNPSLCLVDGVVFSKDRKTLLLYPGGYTRTEYRIPDGTEEIAYDVFGSGKHLKRVYVPTSVKHIGYDNFVYMILENEQLQGYEYPYEVWYGGSRDQWNVLLEDVDGAEGLKIHYNATKIG